MMLLKTGKSACLPALSEDVAEIDDTGNMNTINASDSR
jgi:hypothetical protein